MRTRLQPTPALHLQRMAGWGGARARASSVGLCGLQDRAGCCWDTQWGRGWHGDALRGTGALLGALHVHPNLGAMAFPEEPLHPSNLSTASLGPALSQGDIPQQHHMGCVISHPVCYLTPFFTSGIKALCDTKSNGGRALGCPQLSHVPNHLHPLGAVGSTALCPPPGAARLSPEVLCLLAGGQCRNANVFLCLIWGCGQALALISFYVSFG